MGCYKPFQVYSEQIKEFDVSHRSDTCTVIVTVESCQDDSRN